MGILVSATFNLEGLELDREFFSLPIRQKGNGGSLIRTRLSLLGQELRWGNVTLGFILRLTLLLPLFSANYLWKIIGRTLQGRSAHIATALRANRLAESRLNRRLLRRGGAVHAAMLGIK